MSNIKQNTTDLQSILETINNLPEAGSGVDLPTLTNEGAAADLLQGKQLINSDGEIVTGTIETLSIPAPSIAVGSSGIITATTRFSENGYVKKGTQFKTKQLTTKAATTITPSTSEQTAVSSGVYTTGAIKVAAIPSTYVQPSSRKLPTTYTPTTTDQVIAEGTYCVGAQTIKGDTNLKAENIKKDVSVFGVTGTYEGSGSSSGGDAPDAFFAIKMSYGDYEVSYIELIPFKTGMTWLDFYNSRLNNPITNVDWSTGELGFTFNKINGYDPDSPYNPEYTIFDPNYFYLNRVSIFIDEDGNRPDWNDEIQPVTDFETMSPYYISKYGW